VGGIRGRTCHNGRVHEQDIWAWEFYNGEGYPFSEWSPKLDVSDLFRLLGLAEQHPMVTHIMERVERFRN